MSRTIDFPRRALTGFALAVLIFGAAPQPVLSASDPFGSMPQITSAGLVEAVMARNLDLPVAQASWEAAQARIEQAGALDDPMLSYALAPNTLGGSNTDVGQNLSLTQRLSWPGKQGLRERAARSETAAVRENIERTRLRLAEVARTLFSDWYFVHAAIRVNETDKTLLSEFQDIVEVRYGAGTASRQDVLRAEMEHALLEHRSIILERRRREVLTMINILLERHPDALLPPPGNLPSASTPPPSAPLRTAALDAHPELRALDARIDAAKIQVELAESEFLPDFQLTAGYNSLWAQQEKRFTVGAAINLPLRGRRNAALAEARAALMGIEMERRSVSTQIVGDVQQAYDLVGESAHVWTLYHDRLVPLAEENLSVARADYEAGNGDFLDLVSTERNLMQTRLQVERALAEHHRNLAALERATGGTGKLFDATTARGGL